MSTHSLCFHGEIRKISTIFVEKSVVAEAMANNLSEIQDLRSKITLSQTSNVHIENCLCVLVQITIKSTSRNSSRK